jgi:hypothetical protein
LCNFLIRRELKNGWLNRAEFEVTGYPYIDRATHRKQRTADDDATTDLASSVLKLGKSIVFGNAQISAIVSFPCKWGRPGRLRGRSCGRIASRRRSTVLSQTAIIDNEKQTKAAKR